MNRNTETFKLGVLPMMLITLIFGLSFGLMPTIHDDYWFLSFASTDSVLHGIGDNFIYRFLYDNGRLPNLFGTALMLLPKWVIAAALTLCFGVSLIDGARLSGGWLRQTPTTALWCAAVVFLLPWYDYMYTTMFALNYIPATMLAFIAIRLIVKRKPLRRNSIISIGLLCCLWHEMTAVALVGALLGLIIAFPKYRSRHTLTWLATCVAGLLYYFIVPATYLKLDSKLMLEKFFALNLGLFNGLPFYIFCLLLIVVLIIPSTRRRFFTPRMAAIFGAALASWVLWRCFLTGYRNSWLMICFSSIGICHILGNYTIKNYRRINLLIFTISIVQPLACLPWFAIMRNEINAAIALVNENPYDNGLFVDATTPAQAPIYTLGRPNFDIYTANGYPSSRIVPNTLINFDPSKATSIGTNIEAYLYEGLIVAKDNPAISSLINCTIYFDGKPFNTECTTSRFSVEKGTFIYILPKQTFVKQKLHTITEFELN